MLKRLEKDLLLMSEWQSSTAIKNKITLLTERRFEYV